MGRSRTKHKKKKRLECGGGEAVETKDRQKGGREEMGDRVGEGGGPGGTEEGNRLKREQKRRRGK